MVKLLQPWSPQLPAGQGAASPPSWGQHPPLLAAEQAAQGTGLGSSVSLLSGVRPSVTAGPPEQGPRWLRGRLAS